VRLSRFSPRHVLPLAAHWRKRSGDDEGGVRSSQGEEGCVARVPSEGTTGHSAFLRQSLAEQGLAAR